LIGEDFEGCGWGIIETQLQDLPVGTEEMQETGVRISDVPAKILTEYLQDKSLERHRSRSKASVSFNSIAEINMIDCLQYRRIFV
jgi:hypothetical protein